MYLIPLDVFLNLEMAIKHVISSLNLYRRPMQLVANGQNVAPEKTNSGRLVIFVVSSH